MSKPEVVGAFVISALIVAGTLYNLNNRASEARSREDAFETSCDRAGGKIAWGKCMRKDLFIDVKR
jgi:hypothetical protein